MPGAFQFPPRYALGFLLVAVQNPDRRPVVVGVEKSGVAGPADANRTEVVFAADLLAERPFQPSPVVEHEKRVGVLLRLLDGQTGLELLALVRLDYVFHFAA